MIHGRRASFDIICERLYDDCLKHKWSKLKRWRDLDTGSISDASTIKEVRDVALAAMSAMTPLGLNDWFRMYTHEYRNMQP